VVKAKWDEFVGMHYLFEDWVAGFAKAASLNITQEQMADLVGITSRTLRTYSKLKRDDSFKPYAKIMKGLAKHGFGNDDQESFDHHIDSMKEGKFRGFYFDNFSEGINEAFPDLGASVHFTINYMGGWLRLADIRNMPKLDETSKGDLIEYFKTSFPYREFDVELALSLTDRRWNSKEQQPLQFEIGFSLIVAMVMDYFSCFKKPIEWEWILTRILASHKQENIIGTWLKHIRDEVFSGSSDEFYEAFGGGLSLDESGQLLDVDDAKRTYLRMCSDGKCSWKQIGRIFNALGSSDHKVLIALGLELVIYKSINYYVSQMTEAKALITTDEFKFWYLKWLGNIHKQYRRGTT